MKKINIATVFSGIGSPKQAIKKGMGGNKMSENIDYKTLYEQAQLLR